jgi:lipopolysaccharide export system protein LptA
MSKPYFRNSVLIVFSFLFLTAAVRSGQPVKKNQEPIVITSNRMEAEKLGDKVTFVGNVILKKEGMTLTSDRMIVFYLEKTKNVREVEAHGNVTVTKEGRVALSNDASYFTGEEKVILTGNARIVENDNQLNGEKITLFVNDGRSIVEGGKVLIYQDKEGKVPQMPQGRKLK